MDEPGPAAPSTTRAEPTDRHDPLPSLRAELEAIDEVAVADRVALFERANTTIASELAQLDEV